MDSFTSMSKKMRATGLYKISEGNNNYAELKAYAAGLDMLFGKLDEMKSEYFIDTAQSYGIVNRERFTGAVRDDLTIEKRREMLKTRELTNETTCSPEAFEKIVAGYGLSSFTIKEYPSTRMVLITINDDLTESDKVWVRYMIANDFPAHLNVQVVF